MKTFATTFLTAAFLIAIGYFAWLTTD